MLEVLKPIHVTERMNHRKAVSVLSKKYPFGNVTTPGLHQNFNKFKDKRSEIIGFKSRQYACSENGGYATCVIEKRLNEDLSFWVKTVECTAISGQDFEGRN
jgi:hypothetical protein